MSKEQDKKNSRPSYSGYEMPMNVNPMGLDEGGEETTRRIAFQPSFEPVSTFQPPPGVETTFVGSTKSPRASTSSGKVGPGNESRGVWKLQQVPTLPEYHPLERAAVFVPNASPYDVSMRISDVLRQRSIEAFYEDDKAKVRCTTTEGVDFRIRLYGGRGRFNHGIIVEVQRRFGTSNTFHSDTMAILDASEGKTPCPPPPCSSIPLVSDSEDDYQPSGSSSLKMVAKMLSHEGYDSYYLAFQTLASLTDASKMGASTAHSVSMELLRVDSDIDVGSKVLSFVLDKKGEDEMFKLRSMAMLVLANAVQAVHGQIHEMLREQLRPVLIKELRMADKSPRNAVQAARAIECLLSEELNLNDIHSALEFALEAGTARHAALQRQAQQCLDKIV
jgi:hypothetical protein